MEDIGNVTPGKPVWPKRPEDEHSRKQHHPHESPAEETPADDVTDDAAPEDEDDDGHQLDVYV